MTKEEAARILNPETTWDALTPYIYDPDRRISVVEEACRIAAAALRADHSADAGKMVPMTIEQLREMDGRPAYWPEDGSWGIILVDTMGRWAGKPFFRGRWQGVNFEYDITERGMELYAYPPAHIDREAWEPCDKCKKCASCIDSTENVNDPGSMCFSCEHYGNHRPRNFCPQCGRPLTPEAWAELKKRLGV